MSWHSRAAIAVNDQHERPIRAGASERMALGPGESPLRVTQSPAQTGSLFTGHTTMMTVATGDRFGHLVDRGEEGTTMRIGIAVDGSSQAVAGVELVASLPLSGGDHVTVVSVAEPPMLLSAAPFGQVPSVSGFVRELVEMSRERARQTVEHAAERLVGLPCPVDAVVRAGHPIESLERFAADVGLTCSSSVHGEGQHRLDPPGSVSQALLHALPTSILVARPPTSTPTRVLLAVDGSPSSLEAARYLATFPLPVDADIRVLVSVTSDGRVPRPFGARISWNSWQANDGARPRSPTGPSPCSRNTDDTPCL